MEGLRVPGKRPFSIGSCPRGGEAEYIGHNGYTNEGKTSFPTVHIRASLFIRPALDDGTLIRRCRRRRWTLLISIHLLAGTEQDGKEMVKATPS